MLIRNLRRIFASRNLENSTIMGIISSSIARKVAMALSGLFLVFFLGQHFVINATAVLSPDTFNSWSHFMGNNGLVQGLLQPILIFGVVLVILAFLGLHFYDFWIPEMIHKYVESHPEDPTRYYAETVHKFENPIRVGLYVVSFALLAMHLWHGFASSFQSVGFNNKYSVALTRFAKVYAILIPVGFIFIAIYLHLNQVQH